MRSLRIRSLILALLAVGSAGAHAQALRARADTPRLDFGVSFNASRSLKAASGENFWITGGSAELGVDAWRGLGIAANVTGGTSSSIGTSGIPITLVTTTFGPRYRWHSGHKVSIYGEGLVGEANGYHSLFPVTGAAQDSANGLAVQAGGGIDIAAGRHFAIRAVHASWLRTQLPNATDNVQNSLQLGAGVVVRWGR